MDPRFLRTFVTVVRLGSFSRAAEELGYTQSAVSQHIGVLEADLGTTLLTRRPVAPTEAGARLLEHAEPILLRLDAARADVARVAGGPPRSLRIGTTPLACAHAASLVTPALTVTVRVGSRLEVARAVATGELDVGFVDGVAAVNDPLHLPELGLIVAGVWEEELAVAVPADHPLAGHADARGPRRRPLDRRADHLRPARRARRDRPRRGVQTRAGLRRRRHRRAAGAGRRRAMGWRCSRAGPSSRGRRAPDLRHRTVLRTEWLQDSYG